jgi:hypothetical protein
VSSRPVKGISTRSLPDRAAAAAIRLTNFHGLAVGIDCLGHRQSRLAVFRGFVQATKGNRDDDDKESVPHETAVGAGDRSRLLISRGLSRADRRAGGRRDAFGNDYGRIRRRDYRTPKCRSRIRRTVVFVRLRPKIASHVQSERKQPITGLKASRTPAVRFDWNIRTFYQISFRAN